MARLMGGTHEDINLKGSPAVILMSGLQGSNHFSKWQYAEHKRGKIHCW